MTDYQMMEALARQALHIRKRLQKPRIGWCRNLQRWACVTTDGNGFGRTPKEAYAHWMDSPRRSEFINCEVQP